MKPMRVGCFSLKTGLAARILYPMKTPLLLYGSVLAIIALLASG